MYNNTFYCSNIKHNLSWRVDGSVQPCNQITNFPKFYSVEHLRSSPEYDKLSNGSTEYCIRCLDKESINLNSKRLIDNQTHSVYAKLHTDYLKVDGAIGSVCNAGCRICGSHSSSFWQSEDRKFNRTVAISDTRSTIWSEIEKYKDSILQLDLGGGEPWLNELDKQEALLEYWIQTDRAKLIKLRYNTNASLYPSRLLDKFQHFREIRITLSLDDTGDRFQYNRYPLQWNNVMDNIRKLQKLPGVKIDINFTISVFTFLYADAFIDCVRNIGGVNFNILSDPSIYSIKSMPLRVKEHINPNNKFFNLVATSPVDNWYTNFSQLTEKLDKQRNQTFEKIFPELNSIINL
jgi:hypothetical protein